ncbi:MAG: FAD-binding protein [Bacteroidales bacterium]|nr:FAD-binding protein [Bacteroidales bacterium]
MNDIHNKLEGLRKDFQGDIYLDEYLRTLYSTDASAYKELPIAVTRPMDKKDIHKLIDFANSNNVPLIPRTAGTSLAGQVVGSGIIVDVSKYMTEIIELNVKEKWVDVEPGVILDDLNLMLSAHGLFFGPETSTSSRCMIAGMVGNNSCGAHSLVYGSTREHTLKLETILSDGSEVVFEDVSKSEFDSKCQLDTLEGDIYRKTKAILENKENQEEIIKEFPEPDLHRRNTGYAIDLLLAESFFGSDEPTFNFSKLLAGSEGTLAFTTAIRLNLVDLPPKNKALVCVHLNSVQESLKANLIALKHKPVSIELMDKAIMDLTKANPTQAKNRFFVKDDPGAILIVEFTENDEKTLQLKIEAMEAELRSSNYGFHFPVVTGANIKRVWSLRKAGLGLLANMPGDAKPVPVIEDTAVIPEKLPAYIEEFDAILAKYDLECVYYAHIATGELHLRPVLDLKKKEDVEMFHTIALETAHLVKKYKGSLSGEHGDGRLRGEFIPLMIGEHNYKLIKEVKNIWDPNNIMNPGKITETPKMNEQLRYKPGQQTKEIETIFDFSSTGGFLRGVEKCNGSGDCRKTELTGGTMCPSYMATRDEQNATRARANTLREYITNSTKINPFDHKEIYDSLDLCLSCKACKSECPSNIDMTKFKAEFLQHWYDKHGVPIRSLFIAYITSISKLGMILPWAFNFVAKNKFLSEIIKNAIGFAPKRSIPTLYKTTLRSWTIANKYNGDTSKGKVMLFADEFTNYNDVEIGIKTMKLLNSLGYEVIIPKHKVSGRTFLSKGLLRKAKKIANANVEMLADKVGDNMKLIGIEPSAILTFRDEYPELVDEELRDKARNLGSNALMVDEFLWQEMKKGSITKSQFTDNAVNIKLHGHCQQKAVAGTLSTMAVLGFPSNYSVEEIPSGCCGMAGSFGYEKEHYDISMAVGELVLFPAVRKMPAHEIIVAPGTSCRHQIHDGAEKDALHPVEVLYDALVK